MDDLAVSNVLDVYVVLGKILPAGRTGVGSFKTRRPDAIEENAASFDKVMTASNNANCGCRTRKSRAVRPTAYATKMHAIKLKAKNRKETFTL